MPRPAAPFAPAPAVTVTRVLTVGLEPLPELPVLGAMWTGLERRAEASFFLSWPWVRCWLRCLPPAARPAMLTVREGDELLGLALFGRHRGWRRLVLRPRQWLLHETGDPRMDSLFVEYNGLLADRRQASAITAAALDWLATRAPECDELVFGGLAEETAALARGSGRRSGRLLRIDKTMPTYQVDLDAVRRGGGDYLAGLSRNTRSALRRALRLYAAEGPIEFGTATTVEQALADFAELKRLHQTAWNGRGRAGAFAHPQFERFHIALIREAFAAGHVQLCRIAAGGRPIGYLYNFRWRGRIYAYQSGFAFSGDNRLKPGLVSHYLALLHALSRGDRVYDLMAGRAQYKESLAAPGPELVWLTLSANRLPFRVEAWLRRAKERVLG